MFRATFTLMVVGALAGVAAAQPTVAVPEKPTSHWSLALVGGALAPVGDMRSGYQDALVAGVRVGWRSRMGLGVKLAIDYSPLPRRPVEDDSVDTTYGTVALVPGWTLGRGTFRVHLGAGGGVALERLAGAGGDVEQSATPAAIGQVGLEIHVTDGGGLVVLGGATRTFGERDYQYGWGLGGLTLEF